MKSKVEYEADLGGSCHVPFYRKILVNNSGVEG